MSSVLDGRRLRFTRVSRDEVYGRPTYDVAAIAVSRVLSPVHVHLGQVEAITISTDRHYGRIRSPGKGRRGWNARVSSKDAVALGYRGESRIGRSGTEPYLSWGGWDFETRREAAEALVHWHDHPETRVSAEELRDG